jgi:hypothetical protein
MRPSLSIVWELEDQAYRQVLAPPHLAGEGCTQMTWQRESLPEVLENRTNEGLSPAGPSRLGHRR